MRKEFYVRLGTYIFGHCVDSGGLGFWRHRGSGGGNRKDFVLCFSRLVFGVVDSAFGRQMTWGDGINFIQPGMDKRIEMIYSWRRMGMQTLFPIHGRFDSVKMQHKRTA
jgi:hypothetical protein